MKLIIVLIGLLLSIYPQDIFAQNLIQNGDFENGSSGWIGGSIVTDNPHSGNYCMYVNDNSTSLNIAARNSNYIEISQNKSYKFSVWYRANEKHIILVAISQYRSDDSHIAYNNTDISLEADSNWKNLSIFINSFHPEARKIRISLHAVMWTEEGELMGDAYFDDVEFVENVVVQNIHGNWIYKNSNIRVWQASSMQKVDKKSLPAESAPFINEVTINIAGGEYELSQIILNPEIDEEIDSVYISDLLTDKGDKIGKANIILKKAMYVNITYPTDYSSNKGEVPDPLVDLNLPIKLNSNQNQPFYIIIKVPQNSKYGSYSGELRFLTSSQKEIVVPLMVNVWDFELPYKHSIRTAIGLDWSIIPQYHNISDAEKLKALLDLYLKDLSEHRLSPYNPFIYNWYNMEISQSGWSGSYKIIEDQGGLNHYIEIIDDKNNECVNAYTFNYIKVDNQKSYTLRWTAQAGIGSDYLVSINQYDNNKNWISGANIDFVVSGTGEFKQESQEIYSSLLRQNTSYLKVRLFGRRWTENCELTGNAQFDNIIFSEKNSDENMIFNGDFEKAGTEILMDVNFSEFDRRADYLFNVLNFDSFKLPLYQFAYGSWEGVNTDVDIFGHKWGSKEYEDLFIRIMRPITEHLKEIDILKYAYTYWFDEPVSKDYNLVVYGNDLIKRMNPELKRLLTEQAESELLGYVDIWSPVLDQYSEEWAFPRQKLGEEVWLYVCTSPKAPYPNRILLWMNWKYNVTGYLYWSVNYWDDCIDTNGLQNPYLDPESYRCGQPDRVWGNGDGRLIYPSVDYTDGREKLSPPVPSIRYELIREGIEDYEYFSLLKTLVSEAELRGIDQRKIDDAKKLLEIPGEIISSRTDYTHDPELIESYRIMLGSTIETLKRLIENNNTPDAGFDGGIEVLSDTETVMDSTSGDNELPDIEVDSITDYQLIDTSSNSDAILTDVKLEDSPKADIDTNEDQKESTDEGGCGCIMIDW